MASNRTLSTAALILRVLTLILLVASIAAIATAKIYAPDIDDVVDPPYITFKDLYSCRYVLAVGAIGCAYTLTVIPFAVIGVARRRMTGGSEGGIVILVFADIVISGLLATGAAAGLGHAVEYQGSREKYLDSDWKKFFQSVDASCGLLLIAAVCMVIVVMLSVHSLTK